MIKLQNIHIRDPFILVHDGCYYMYGTTDKNCWGGPAEGFHVYKSANLVDFEDAVKVFTPQEGFWANEHFWAPEVHEYKGKFYMFASFFRQGRHRATHILVSDSPMGPFAPNGDAPQTPSDWECLDGTLYIEDGTPYMCFCHEWVQIGNGTIAYVKLDDALKNAVSEPRVLFKATDAPWVKSIANNGGKNYITDGPWFYRHSNGKLYLLWSSLCETGYAVGLAVSDSGSIHGEFRQIEKPLFSGDGGHAMLFKDLDGGLNICMHRPNVVGIERPYIVRTVETADGLEVKV